MTWYLSNGFLYISRSWYHRSVGSGIETKRSKAGRRFYGSALRREGRTLSLKPLMVGETYEVQNPLSSEWAAIEAVERHLSTSTTIGAPRAIKKKRGQETSKRTNHNLQKNHPHRLPTVS